MKEVSVHDLKKMIDEQANFQLIDVREPYEHENANVGGEVIPLGTIVDESARISREVPVVIYCRSGARSAAAVRELESRFGFSNIHNLKGGILAWSKEIDPTIQVF